ncbi:MAG TPA: N-acetylmuramoyl-L-alanine amidase [Vicinamibacteria bacterium]|nr:N-acetylmuramoyl-L-alanine amidase [Vicinamibacteria bacterium]
MRALLAAGLLAALAPAPARAAGDVPALPPRVRRIVLHTLGHPGYDRPELRFTFLPPPQTQALWKRGFGAHWIVWTDGSVWPRRRAAGPPSWRPQSPARASAAERRRLAWEAVPALGHLHHGNSRSVGIEVAHSGRRADPFPEAQLATVSWLVRTLMEMSQGRLGPRSVFGHKDLDRRPAYLSTRCARAGCPVFVDGDGRAYRRRVDPPEALFAGLARHGLLVPRPAGGDEELARAERLPSGRRPAVSRAAADRGARVGAAP